MSKNPHSNQGEPDPDHGGREKYERHVDGNITVRGQIETHIPPDAAKQHDAEREDDKTRAKKTYVVSIATLIAVIVYAFLTLCQVWLTRTQFHKDQRPYVWVLDYILPGNIRIAENQKLSVSIAIVNYGKSPALHVRFARKIFIGQDSIQQAYKWFDGFKDRTTKYVEGESLVPPGIPPDPTKAFGYETAFSDDPLTHDNVVYIFGTEKPFTVVFRFSYEDSFGGNFWSEACYQRQRNGAMAHCEKHNSADSD